MGGSLIKQIVSGIGDSLGKITSAAGKIIKTCINGIKDGFSNIVSIGGSLLKKVASGIVEAIPNLVSKIPKIITAIVNGLKNGLGSLQSVGGNLLQGLWNGIANVKDWLVSKIKGLGSVVTSALKSVLGIHSPSTVFRDEIGTNLALGLGEGFENTMKRVKKDMENSVPTTFDIKSNLQGVKELAMQKLEQPAQQGGIVINLNIENFSNNTQQDIRNLANELSEIIAAQVRRKGVAF